jgi:hypothetical protein
MNSIRASMSRTGMVPPSNRILAVLGSLLIGAAVCQPAAAGTINVNAVEPSNWLVTGAGATNATPFSVNGHLTITSTQTNSGTFISGGSLSNFDGFWTAIIAFTLPADASNVSLSFSSFQSDDRAVLELNPLSNATGPSNVIGNSGNGSAGIGQMQFTDRGTLQSFNFTTAGIPGGSGTVTTGFIPGAVNILEVIVNNTGTGLTGATATFQNVSDKTYFKLNGTVTYTDGPEPSSMILFSVGAALLLAKKRFC